MLLHQATLLQTTPLLASIFILFDPLHQYFSRRLCVAKQKWWVLQSSKTNNNNISPERTDTKKKEEEDKRLLKVLEAT
jgi:hypothetical protein